MSSPSKSVLIIDSYSLNTGDVAILQTTLALLERKCGGNEFSLELSHPKYIRSKNFFPKYKVFGRLLDIEDLTLYEDDHVVKIRCLTIGLYDLFTTIIWSFAKRWGVSIDWLPRKVKLEYLKVIENADLVISSGGGFLSTRYNYLLRVHIYLVAILLKRNIVTIGQSFGPFETRLSQKLIPKILTKFKLIQVRESWSYKYLKEFLKSEELEKTSDIVLSMSVPKSNKSISKSISLCVKKQKVGNYEENLLQISKRLIDLGYEINLISHTPADDALLKRLEGALNSNKTRTFDFNPDPQRLLSVYQNSKFVITNRMHGAIFAIISNVPFLAIAYEPKFEGLLKDISYPKQFLLKEDSCCRDTSALDKAVQNLMENEIELKSLLANVQDKLKWQAEKNIDNLCKIL